MIKSGIKKLLQKRDLEEDEARSIMAEIMSGRATEAQIGAFLTALRFKGETTEEIRTMASQMRSFCRSISPRVSGRLVDTCGTGGDSISTFNVSTAAALVVAGAGIAVAKHGNRSVTSSCGSADVLEQLGLNLKMQPKDVERLIERAGIGLMFAPVFHPAMRYAAGPRRQIGIRTVFNVLGPLTNPAGPTGQLVGVFSEAWLERVARALISLGCEEAMVVHGKGGMDELSILGPTSIAWARDGEVELLTVDPRQLGLQPGRPEQIRGSGPRESAEILFRLVAGIFSEEDARMRMLLMNAAAGIVVGGGADDFSEALEMARQSIQSGAAYEKLSSMIRLSGGDTSRLEELEAMYA